MAKKSATNRETNNQHTQSGTSPPARRKCRNKYSRAGRELAALTKRFNLTPEQSAEAAAQLKDLQGRKGVVTLNLSAAQYAAADLKYLLGPGADVSGRADYRAQLKEDVQFHWKNAAQADRAFACIACGEDYTPERTQWIFHQLCGDCFAEFDDQKMAGRFGRLSPYFESAKRWSRYRRAIVGCALNQQKPGPGVH